MFLAILSESVEFFGSRLLSKGVYFITTEKDVGFHVYET